MTQTTLNLFTKRILSAFIAVTIVTSCASQNSNQSDQLNTNDPELNIDIDSNTLSAQYYLTAAESENPEQSTNLLFKAAHAYIEEGNYVESLWLANKLSELTLNESQQYELSLLKVESLLLSKKINDAKNSLY